jgi:hypothetical protein
MRLDVMFVMIMLMNVSHRGMGMLRIFRVCMFMRMDMKVRMGMSNVLMDMFMLMLMNVLVTMKIYMIMMVVLIHGVLLCMLYGSLGCWKILFHDVAMPSFRRKPVFRIILS